MNLVELLRTQARRYRCPACGEGMADCEINVLVQQGNHALVRVTCSKCSDVNLLKIVIQAGAEASGSGRRRPPQFDEPHDDEAVPVGVDDVLDVHLALEGWSGDLRSLIGATAD